MDTSKLLNETLFDFETVQRRRWVDFIIRKRGSTVARNIDSPTTIQEALLFQHSATVYMRAGGARGQLRGFY